MSTLSDLRRSIKDLIESTDPAQHLVDMGLEPRLATVVANSKGLRAARSK